MTKFDTTIDESCMLGVDAVSYIYGELTSAETDRFESHIADCGSCIDELSALSYSRFSVYEWERDVFAKLETPQIVIPYEATRTAAENAGFWESVSAFFKQPAYAGGFAVIAIAVVAGTFALSWSGSEELAAIPTVTTPASVLLTANSDEKNSIDSETEIGDPIEPQPMVSRSKIPVTKRIAAGTKDPIKTQRIRKAATADATLSLAGFQETEDDTLRLSQMLDELGG